MWSNVCGKLLHYNTSQPSFSKPVWFHPPYWVLYQCKSNSFPGCLESIFLVFHMSRSYQNKPNSFCYICSEVVWKSQRKPLSKLVRKAYELYFGCKIGDQEKVWWWRICLFKAKISQNKGGQEEIRIFIGPQITQIFKNQDFSTKLNNTDRRDWETF